MITRISIRNFKAIRNGTIELTPVHLLIGPNDSGKTSVLEAIAAICRSVDHSVNESFLGRWQGRELVHSGSEEPVIEISIETQEELTYTMEVGFPSTDKSAELIKADVHSDGNTTSIRYDTNKTLTMAASGSIYRRRDATKNKGWDEAEKISEQLKGCLYLRWTARNLALPVALNPKRTFRLEGNGFGLATLIDDLLSYDRANFGNLENEFIEIFPNVRGISLIQTAAFDAPVDNPDETLQLNPSSGKQIVFRLKNTEIPLPASQAAEGMLYILGYLALMYLPDPPRVLLIEEPENGIHPHRLADIVKILRRLQKKHPATQIVLTSHSPYLVDEFSPEEVTWCRRESETGDVQFQRLDRVPEVQRGLSLFSLGEIWAGELEPATSMNEEL